MQNNPSTGLHRHCQLQPPTIAMLIEVDFEKSGSTSHITFPAIQTKTLEFLCILLQTYRLYVTNAPVLKWRRILRNQHKHALWQ